MCGRHLFQIKSHIITYICTYVQLAVYNLIFHKFISLSHVAITILKKHYYNILRSFPSDHMTSLSRLCQGTVIDDAIIDRIISCSTSQESNTEILDTLISKTGTDGSLIKFCNAIEEIIGSNSPEVETLRNGKQLAMFIIFVNVPSYVVCIVCTHKYVHCMYVCTYVAVSGNSTHTHKLKHIQICSYMYIYINALQIV